VTWPTPNFSRNQVSKAGDLLARHDIEVADFQTLSLEKLDKIIDAYDVLANWRACHGYPINTFQATLRNRLRKVDETALVAQRLKRTPSILNKLRRFKGMNLARMQDIGGLRAVVKNPSALALLNEAYLSGQLTHELVAQYDYVRHPKPSGYRSIHLVYRYKARSPTPYDGLLLELQLRTRVQHSWFRWRVAHLLTWRTQKPFQVLKRFRGKRRSFAPKLRRYDCESARRYWGIARQFGRLRPEQSVVLSI
jgi:putative GTP pyrophosphokinase